MRWLLFYIIFFSSYPCFIQGQSVTPLVLSQITEDNGLSDNHVKCVLKDERGVVWVGTDDGLNVMDGSTITVFRHKNDKNSIGNNNINALAEDGTGNIWIGTNTGLTKYDIHQNIFINLAPPQSPYGESKVIVSLAIDKQQNIWCGTTGGLMLFSEQTKNFIPFYITADNVDSKKANRLVHIMIDAAQKMWVCSHNGVWSFNTGNKKYKREISADNDPLYEDLFTYAFEDHLHRLWIGSWSRGLKQLDRGKVTTWSQTINDPIRYINETIKNNESTIWISGKLVAFKPEKKKFFQFQKPLFLNEYPNVYPAFHSSDGWLWLASDIGLFIYAPQKQIFQHRFYNSSITSQTPSLAEWQNRLLIGGGGNEFLKTYNDSFRVTGNLNRLQKLLKNSTEKKPVVLSLFPEDENNLWITTSAGIISISNNHVHTFMHNSKDSNSLPGDFVLNLFIDSKKQIWFFPWREGVWTLNKQTGKSKRLWEGFIQSQGITKRLVIADAKEDEYGNIWMADIDEGAILYERLTGKFSKPFGKHTGDMPGIIKIIYSKGFLYSFSYKEIFKWHPQKKQLLRIPLPDEMQKDIYDMVPDTADNWWFATKNGLMIFNEKAQLFKKFSTVNGLLSNDMNGVLLTRKNGTIVFVANNYLTAFNPKELIASVNTTMDMLVTAVSVNGKRVKWDSTTTLQLDHNSNNIQFKWALPDYTNPLRNQYYCRLLGIDSAWNYRRNTGEIQYANLSQGSYQLQLRANTFNGVPAANTYNIHFVIKPPFWKTSWFLLIIFIVISCIIYLLTARRIQSIKKKAALQQQIANLELKALRAQINPHFIFNSLSSIQESIVNNKTEAAEKYLGKFSKLLRMVLENSELKLISLQSEIDYLKLYMELESFRFENFEFFIDCEKTINTDFIRIPPMIVQPYVENAIKHGLAHKEGEKKLWVRFYIEENYLKVSVADNGVGRKSSAKLNVSGQEHHSMGMQITQQRLSLLNDQNENTVMIDDIIDNAGKLTGTRVIVTLPTEANI
ncbi:MAG TPA: two-component regulator propeller domain-containing protein [Chitinophagaceae bacterium]|nr:two-component regulator propeller domain-containing protein [Chitinophagaceae bacterium]